MLNLTILNYSHFSSISSQESTVLLHEIGCLFGTLCAPFTVFWSTSIFNPVFWIPLNTRDAQTCIISFTGFLLTRKKFTSTRLDSVVIPNWNLEIPIVRNKVRQVRWIEKKKGFCFSLRQLRKFWNSLSVAAWSTGQIHLSNHGRCFRTRSFAKFILNVRTVTNQNQYM